MTWSILGRRDVVSGLTKASVLVMATILLVPGASADPGEDEVAWPRSGDMAGFVDEVAADLGLADPILLDGNLSSVSADRNGTETWWVTVQYEDGANRRFEVKGRGNADGSSAGEVHSLRPDTLPPVVRTHGNPGSADPPPWMIIDPDGFAPARNASPQPDRRDEPDEWIRAKTRSIAGALDLPVTQRTPRPNASLPYRLNVDMNVSYPASQRSFPEDRRIPSGDFPGVGLPVCGEGQAENWPACGEEIPMSIGCRCIAATVDGRSGALEDYRFLRGIGFINRATILFEPGDGNRTGRDATPFALYTSFWLNGSRLDPAPRETMDRRTREALANESAELVGPVDGGELVPGAIFLRVPSEGNLSSAQAAIRTDIVARNETERLSGHVIQDAETAEVLSLHLKDAVAHRFSEDGGLFGLVPAPGLVAVSLSGLLAAAAAGLRRRRP